MDRSTHGRAPLARRSMTGTLCAWLVVALFLVSLSACAPARPTATSMPTALVAASVAPTITLLPTLAAPTNSATPVPVATHTSTPTHVPTDMPAPTVTPSPEPTGTPTAEPTDMPTAAPTSTPVVQVEVAVAAGHSAGEQAQRSGPVLANYFAWYSAGGWDGCNISNGDKPLQPYDSDDAAAIGRHVQQALDAGIDGFTLQWFAPGERTDNNLNALLAQSQGTSFRSTVVFLRHIWGGTPAPSHDEIVHSIRYLLDRYSGHENFAKLEGRPVIFFTDLYRVPTAPGQSPQDAWAEIRAEADPDHAAWWIAEGLDSSYLAVFDGLYVYKIVHASYPDAYLKAAQWAAEVRAWEEKTGQRKLWWATISPGWDDLRSACASDIRVPSEPFRRDRADGSFYRSTFEAALASQPDGLWINSYNEWVEGTYIEPSVQYGDQYLTLTRELANRYRSSDQP